MNTSTIEYAVAAWSRYTVESSTDPALPAALHAELRRTAGLEPLEAEPIHGLLATLVAKDEDEVVGWAVLVDEAPAATVHWTLAEREADQLANGFPLFLGLTDQELALLATLVDAAANLARDRDRTALLWSSTDDEIDYQLAQALGAAEHRELSRRWLIPSLQFWQPPADIPTARTRCTTVAPTGDELHRYAELHTASTTHPHTPEDIRLDLTALDPDLRADLRTGTGEVLAQLNVVCDGVKAVIARVHHHGAFPLELAALISHAVRELRQAHPEVLLVELTETRDRVLWQALVALGLRVSARRVAYRLPLRAFP
ncbi:MULTISPECIES: hypothetical protein [unclassified Crossiella]|uniref:hypothetical protein n=1 Tax=unclassified Crossiella TaxID=2620835 RepID=UPI001FFF6B28|nr:MULTISPECIES: hypothetical protein [unclassified Crossiella]MCK2241449.1 hypothetical protein [Crossiella sp. S99.2]MCK2255679.1 hypothetical protein [Crossiella sp. S99.1]